MEVAQNPDDLRSLPSVEILASRAPGVPRALAISAARFVLGDLRSRIRAGEKVDLGTPALGRALAERVEALSRSSLRPVINATGVVLHTNLGRSLLAPDAAEAAALAGASYSNLEYDLESGGRGDRQVHVEPLLRELSGAEAALAVNNNAAAVLLALAALAGAGEVVVGRDQLIEIGGSFRIPEILVQAGARMVEVGTTNRTRIQDYERAIGPETATLLRVHQSNFRTVGFTQETSLRDLCRLGDTHGLPVIDDLGSGAIDPVRDEPTVTASVAAGAAVVCCSADKLLGGPQAGLLFGRRNAIECCRGHPLARALRIDKMQLAALEATLRLYLFDTDAIPVVAMLTASPSALRERAERLADAIGERASVQEDFARAGGGSLPTVEFEGPVCTVVLAPGDADAVAADLRYGEPPVVARISHCRLVLDPRTIAAADIELVGKLVRSLLLGR
jgi:L-seryl-tRNA(Ser) seleniumtransferase